MCGILYIANNSFEEKICLEALKTMNHRGPDNLAYEMVNGHYLGHVRLSILDLDVRSNQPFRIGKYLLIYNGEIYNYKELIKEHKLNVQTTSDTEVLLRMFIKYGKKSLSFFNGMFSFVIYNVLTNKIFIARDRLGIKPLYYRIYNKSLIVSSEVEPILKFKSDSFDKFGIRQYKKLRMTIKGYTVYQNIKQFPPGHYYDGNNFHKYWDLEIKDTPPPYLS